MINVACADSFHRKMRPLRACMSVECVRARFSFLLLGFRSIMEEAGVTQHRETQLVSLWHIITH